MDQFWRGKRVLLTGHTGFKGAWTALWLERHGAEVTGIALPPEGELNLYSLLAPWNPARHRSHIRDIRDPAAVSAVVDEADPEIVIHMAAQPLVRRSYRDPAGTFASNVMGTVNLLAATTNRPGVDAVLVVTSDKVYDNKERGTAFRENDPLGGDDPYSASKAAAEIVVRSWRESFLRDSGPVLATARAGNVIGGGDWAEDRLVPDLIRSGTSGVPLTLRHPNSTRPWQHVLDVVSGYLRYVELLATAPRASVPKVVNFGPSSDERVTAVELADALQSAFGWEQAWRRSEEPALPEKATLALDSTLAWSKLQWRPKLQVAEALRWIVEWHQAHDGAANMRDFSLRQIAKFEGLPA